MLQLRCMSRVSLEESMKAGEGEHGRLADATWLLSPQGWPDRLQDQYPLHLGSLLPTCPAPCHSEPSATPLSCFQSIPQGIGCLCATFYFFFHEGEIWIRCWGSFSQKGAVRCWHRQLTEAVDAPCLETLRARLDAALRNLV